MQVASLRTVMEFVKVESVILGKALPCFGYDMFFRVVCTLVDKGLDMRDEAIGVLKAEFLIYQVSGPLLKQDHSNTPFLGRNGMRCHEGQSPSHIGSHPLDAVAGCAILPAAVT